MAFLDENGLRYLWAKIEALLTAYVLAENGKGLSSNDFTDTLLTKLNGIATGADKTTIVNNLTSDSTSAALSAAQGKALKSLIDSINTGLEDLGAGDMLKSVYDTNNSGVVDNAEKVNGHTVLSDVPANAKFTDTVTTVDSTLSGTSTNPVQNKIIAAELDAILRDLSTNYAKKSDITGVYKYKGSVDSWSSLPTSGNTLGDVYNVDERGINYAWNGTAWDALGEVFVVPAIPNAQIDSIVAG